MLTRLRTSFLWTFLLELDNFLQGRWFFPKSQLLRNYFGLDIALSKERKGLCQQSIGLRNFSWLKLGFQKFPDRSPKIQGGGRGSNQF